MSHSNPFASRGPPSADKLLHSGAVGDEIIIAYAAIFISPFERRSFLRRKIAFVDFCASSSSEEAELIEKFYLISFN